MFLGFLFKLVKKAPVECGLEPLYITSEGVYVFFPQNEKESLLIEQNLSHDNSTYRLNEHDLVDLLLGEQDFKLHKIQTEFQSFTSDLQELACSSLANLIETQIELSKHRDGVFFRINMWGASKQTHVLYIENQRAYLPMCEQVDWVTLVEFNQESVCFEDIPVSYVNRRGKNQTGFLLDNKIIRSTSKQINCLDVQPKSVLFNNTVDVKRDHVSSLYLSKIPFSSIGTLEMTVSDPNLEEMESFYEHHASISQGSNILETVNKIITVKEGDSTFYIRADRALKVREEKLVADSGVSWLGFAPLVWLRGVVVKLEESAKIFIIIIISIIMMLISFLILKLRYNRYYHHSLPHE